MARKVLTTSFSIPEALINDLNGFALAHDVSRSKALTAILKVYFREEAISMEDVE